MRRTSVLGALVVLAGCATAPVAVEAPAPAAEFRATGSLQRGPYGASFDAGHVVNPSLTLARHPDGSWSGTFARSGTGTTVPLDLSVTKDAVRGIGFVLVATRPEPGKVVYDGAFQGKRFHFELAGGDVSVKTPTYEGAFSGSLVAQDPPRFEGGGLILTGEAASLAAAPWPQLALALVAAFI